MLEGEEAKVAVVSAEGIHVRHAIGRALATHNRAPGDSTWRVLSARVALDPRGRVASASVTLRIEAPCSPGDPAALGLVNPDGAHPLMALVPGMPGVLLDIFPVTWDRWSRVSPGDVRPAGLDPWCPRVGVTHEQAAAYARAVGKRLPKLVELRAAWGTARFPWGDGRAPALGREAPPRYAEIPEVGMFPPDPHGFYDLGAWLGQWTCDGRVVGASPFAEVGPPGEVGAGLRAAVEL